MKLQFSMAIAVTANFVGLAFAQAVDGSVATLSEVTVVANSPIGGTGIPLSKFAGNVQILKSNDLTPGTASLAERLNQSLGSVTVNDTQGNPFQVDINYRGFTASPILGTPQGISVYLDGMRVNEPFGDVVSWDLLPQIAIDKVTVIPGSNPVYGLNTLGGAISMGTKNGSSFTGSQVSMGAGSFGRKSVDVEHGSHTEDDNIYVAASLYNDDGWAVNNPSKVRQLFGKYMAYGNSWELGVSLAYADNFLYGNQTVPLSMLDNAAQGYSHPDYVGAQYFALNLQGSVEPDSSNKYSGNLYYRSIARDILNSNIGSVVASSTNDATCLANSPMDCPASNLLARYTQNIVGSNLQWTNTDPLWAKSQVMTVGLNTEFSTTRFANSGQNAILDATNGAVGVDAMASQADITSFNQRLGLFATSTLDATDKLSITASARFDYATVKLSGQSCIDDALCDSSASMAGGQVADVGGDHTYQRLNPSLGLTYLAAPNLIAFANYAEGFRTPSAIELACADPAAPCSGVPNAFGADPDLNAVVSKTYEVGVRGNLSDRLRWRAAYFHSVLENDILFNQSTLTTGYFSNVGQTLRRGIELGLDGRMDRLNYAVDLDWTQATYLTGFNLANTANSASSVAVQPGNNIPGIPQWLLKTRVSYLFGTKTRAGLTVLAQGPQYARGDENNADANGQVPGFLTLKLDVNHAVDKTFSAYAGINNVFNAQHSNYGVLAVNNITTGTAEQFRGVGAPRTLYAGIQARF